MINKKTTEEYIKTSVGTTIVHRGTYDEISEILIKKRFRGEKYVSFSDGSPYFPLHGDSYIIFNKEKLIKKKNFLKIKYDLMFFKKNPELYDYIREGKSEEQIKNDFIGYYQKTINKLSSVLRRCSDEDRKDINHQIKLIREQIDNIKVEPMAYFFVMIEHEREILTEQPFEFEYNDIDSIIYSSYQFFKYFPCPEELKRKILFMDDFFPVNPAPFSPLDHHLSSIFKKFIKSEKNIGIDPKVFMLHQLMSLITSNLDFLTDAIMNIDRNLLIPAKWIPIVTKINKIKDKEFKVEIIDHVWRNYLLNNIFYQPTPEIENNLFSKAITSIKE